MLNKIRAMIPEAPALARLAARQAVAKRRSIGIIGVSTGGASRTHSRDKTPQEIVAYGD